MREEELMELTEDIPSPEPTPEEQVLLRERRTALERAVGELSAILF